MIAILLSIMIVFTFMPTMAFAAEEPAATFTVTLADGSAVPGTFATYGEARDRVDKGGTITASAGVIDDDILAFGDGVVNNYKIDVSAATFAAGKKVKVNSEEVECLVGENGVFEYHSTHSWENPVITPSESDPSHAEVTVKCANGHNWEVQDVTGTPGEPEDGFITYTASDLEHPSGLTAAQKKVSWTVPQSEATDTYAVLTRDYRKDGSGLAILDEEGKVQFYATYSKNGTKVINPDGTDATLVGEIVSKTEPSNNKPTPTTTEYGYHNYTVKFKFPNGKYDSTAGLTIPNVADQDYAAPSVQDINAVQYLFKDADGNEFWGVYNNTYISRDTALEETPITYVSNYGTRSEAQTGTAANNTKFNLVVAEDGNLTYRLQFTTDKSGYYEYSEPAQTTLYTESSTAANNAQIFSCGTMHLRYKQESVSFRVGSDIVRRQFYPLNINNGGNSRLTIYGAHEYSKVDSWASQFHQERAATHQSAGTATATCKYCTRSWAGTPQNPYYAIPKKTDHTFKKDASGAEVVETVAPTCANYGFQYKICTKPDAGWTDGTNSTYTIVLDEATNKTYTFPNSTKDSFKNADGTYGHPVLVEGSITDKADHDPVVTSSSTVSWGSTASSVEAAKLTDDVYVSATVGCRNCETNLGKCFFHSLSFADAKKLSAYSTWNLDKDSDNIVTITGTSQWAGKHVFGTVKVEPTQGADCSKLDTMKYTVLGITLVNGSAITKTFNSTVYNGPHTYTNSVVFSADGKTASVLQVCEKADCKTLEDVNGNKKAQEKEAVVTATENSDGSTTYTATLEGVELKDNTKTVYDLTKAEIVVNEGKEVDLNQYPDAEAINKLVVVTINGNELSKDLYDVTYGALKPGNVKITVTAKSVSTGVASVGKLEDTFACIKPALFSDLKVRCDDKLKGSSDYKNVFTYDGTTHVVTAVAQDQKGDVKDASIKFTVIKGGSVEVIGNTTIVRDAKDKVVDQTKLTYDLDKVELTDAATSYVVLAKVTKEGYTDKYYVADVYIINPIVVEKPIIVQAQVIKYGEQLVATTGDAELDKTIGLVVKDTTKLGVGYYYYRQIISHSDNYTVDIEGIGGSYDITIEKRSAKVILKDLTKTYDGKAIDPETLYTVDGAIEGDDLNVLVNTYGDNKIAVEPGTYTLVATANNANYTIEVVPATLKINKKAQKVKSITPSKKTYKASKKTGKLARKKTFNLKAKTSGTSAAKVTFSKVSGNKKFTVTKAGKVTVNKGLKKGTYTLKVKATKAATKHYAKATKTKSIKIVVK
jgi:hypothetical protein